MGKKPRAFTQISVANPGLREAFDEALVQLRARYRDWCRPWIEDAERQYRSGDKNILIHTIWMCLKDGIEIPTWAREAFLDACGDVSKSWDEVFGRPPKRHALMRRRRGMAVRIALRIENLREEGFPIGLDLFDKVGKEYGFSAETVRDSFYYKNPFKAAWIVVKTMLKEIGPDGNRSDAVTWFKQNEQRIAKEFLKALPTDSAMRRGIPHF